MALDPDTVISASLSQEERAVRAFEDIAEALTSWVKLCQQRFEKEYPVKEPREAVVTHVKSEEERLRESQGATGEPIEQWGELNDDDLGPRERELLKKKA